MRVIAGSARGLKLSALPGMQTRPTADRVKEALFSIIASRREFSGARILDICAGSGALGIEALSRGGASCCFIEQDQQVLTLLKMNLAHVGLEARSECLALEAIKGLNLLSRHGKLFDIVLFDPPYASGLYATVLPALSSLSLLSAGGLLVAECSSRNVLTDHAGDLAKVDRRVYGDTALEFYTREFL